MLHPYHHYIMQIDSQFDTMILSLLYKEIDDSKSVLKYLEDQINNCKSEEFKKVHMQAHERQKVNVIIAESKLESWNNKKVVKVNKEKIEELFNI